MAKLEITVLIAERIRSWREKAGKSLDDVVVATGLAPEVLKGYEEGKRPIPLGVLKVLSEMYKVAPEEVAGFFHDVQLPFTKSKCNG